MISIMVASKITKFVTRWIGRGNERSDTQSFWLELLRDVLGVTNAIDYIKFEVPVQLQHKSFIDAFIPKTQVVIEQKSRSKDLNQPLLQSDGTKLTPYQQAKRYGDELPHSLRPRWIIACNFREFLIYDMEKLDAPTKILLEELPEKIKLLDFLLDPQYKKRTAEAISVEAGERIDRLYEILKVNYRAPDSDEAFQSLNKFCVRLVFCLYAESAGIFGKHKIFTSYLETESDIRRGLIDLFRILNTPIEERDPYDDRLNQFPYVNGGLFADNHVEIPRITPKARDILLSEICTFDWKGISPTIFGAVFEKTVNDKVRHAGGMHYTSPENIHKVIDPLFLDELRAEFDSIDSRNRKALLKFQDKLASIKVFDPACGSGNFLTESYISLRKLENKVLKKLLGAQIVLGVLDNPVKVSILQFYGIEIDNFAVAVARTALWISEIQMLAETAEVVHQEFTPLPLKSNSNIHEANALTTDWRKIISPRDCSFIIGNPPFVGKNAQSTSQRAEIATIFEEVKGAGNFDYVTGWYKKAADFIHGTGIRCAFVSTNSITQGEHVAPLWKNLDVHIDFAYRTFKWNNELKSTMAHVHVVIIGFSVATNSKPKLIFDAEGQSHLAQNISGYLIDAPNIYIEKRSAPLCNVPIMVHGNVPVDNGNLIITAEDYDAFVKAEPAALKYIRTFLGAEEFLNGKKRWCLWLVDCPPNELRSMKKVYERVKAVREFRLKSVKAATRKDAEIPMLFREIRQPDSDYILVPRVSSENRQYVPIGFLPAENIVSDSAQCVPGATLYHFGVLTSIVHNAWMRAVCGRLKSDYRYSATIVYNNFPWCEATAEQVRAIEAAAQRILEVRAQYAGASLADLYDALAMPVDLRRAHEENDLAVLSAYGFSEKLSEPEIVAQLMRRYAALQARSART